MRDGNHNVGTSDRNWSASGRDGFRHASVDMHNETSVGGKANYLADRPRSKVLVHNCKIMRVEKTQEPVSSNRIAGSSRPIYRADRGTGDLNSVCERTVWAEKQCMHLILGWVKSSSQRSDNPNDAATLGLCST